MHYGVETSYANMYLLSLGMTKSLLSFVWLAGPLSGLIIQPVIGVMADSSTSKYGRRRPFMVIGSIMVCGSLFTISWAKEIAAELIARHTLDQVPQLQIEDDNKKVS